MITRIKVKESILNKNCIECKRIFSLLKKSTPCILSSKPKNSELHYYTKYMHKYRCKYLNKKP